jgi:hypothetical protein
MEVAAVESRDEEGPDIERESGHRRDRKRPKKGGTAHKNNEVFERM